MNEVFDGFEVRIATQVLKEGSWGSDDCRWDWDMEYHHFFSREDAERFFYKQKTRCERDMSFIDMKRCTITRDRYSQDGYRYDVEDGDPVIEMVHTTNGVEVF